MRKAFHTLICLLAMMSAGAGLRAQEVTIVIEPGWNWISYPNAESMPLAEALSGFVPSQGDQVKSKYTTSTYTGGRWRGGVSYFEPGKGYHYYSTRTEDVEFVFAKTASSTVATATPINITTTSAVVGGMVTVPEGSSVIMRGVCWSTAPNPDIDGAHTSDGKDTGLFISMLDNLTPGTTYYVRAYAVTDNGFDYGDEKSFTTLIPGTLNGLFSVGENNQVYFSQGNLQYQASTNTWRFAENQWDCIREGNENISSTYDGWIDLFNWGTSGYDHGANCYQPWSISEDFKDYNAYGLTTASLFEQSGNADWGYNAISNGGNQEKMWRTMSFDEWHYVLYERETSSGIRFVKAKVNDVEGAIILPDNWNTSNHALNNINEGNADYSQNTITSEEWINDFQEKGAVFLPNGYCRIGNTYADYTWEQNTVYWTSTRILDGDLIFNGAFAYGICLSNMAAYTAYGARYGFSVRLVHTVTSASYSIEAAPNSADWGTVTGNGIYNDYAQVSLTANAGQGYVFCHWKENGNIVSAQNPYNFVAFRDRNLEACFMEASSTYPLYYSFNDEDHTATVTGHVNGKYATGELIIPETVTYNGTDYTVSSIGENAFHGCRGLTGSLTIPNSVTSIGADAFFECYGFNGSLLLSNSLTSIGGSAFGGCSGFTGELVLPNSIKTITGAWYYGAFFGCYGFTGDLVIPNSLTAIEDWTFYGCHGLNGNLVIGDSVAVVGNRAFGNCPFAGSVTIGESVTRIVGEAFDGIGSFNAVYYRGDITQWCEIQFENGSDGTSNPLAHSNSGLLYINNDIVADLVIPNSVNSIENYAFWNCKSLTSLTLPSTLSNIGDWAFTYCNNLTYMSVLADTPIAMGQGVFHEVPKNIPIHVPCGSLEAYQNAEGWNEFTNYIEMCHAYVDLGLPSGTLWATCNIGANAPEDYGDYFAWGETQPKDTYNWGTYQYCNGSNTTLTKYCNNSNYGYNGFTDNLTTLLPEDDAATANWGSDWRMPTKEEWQELLDNTTNTWTTQNGVNGRLFTASNGNSLFLPAAGYRSDSDLYYAGSYGYCWSSSLYTGYPYRAWSFHFDSGNYLVDYFINRNCGRSVRGVRSSRQN